MKAKLSALALALASASSAHAGWGVIDNFNYTASTAQAVCSPVGTYGAVSCSSTTSTISNSSVGAGQYYSSRTFDITNTGASPNAGGANMLIAQTGSTYANTLQISNDSSSASVATVSWTLAGLTIPSGAYWWITIDQVHQDQGSVGVNAFGSFVRTFSTGNLTNVVLNNGTWPSSNTKVTFTSSLDVDSNWDNLTIYWSCSAGAATINSSNQLTNGSSFANDNASSCGAVPLPGTVALLGLGLIGAGALRRKD